MQSGMESFHTRQHRGSLKDRYWRTIPAIVVCQYSGNRAGPPATACVFSLCTVRLEIVARRQAERQHRTLCACSCRHRAFC